MKKTSKIGLIIAVLFLECISDAPRVNPLDPAHGVRGSRIIGKIERLFANEAIAGARLTLKPENLTTQSDMNGYFEMTATIPEGRYVLVCQADGFSSDSLELAIQADREHTANFKLNALPVFNNISLTTRHEASFNPPDDFFLDIAATVSDPDGPGEISRVWFSVESLGFADTLQFVPVPQNVWHFKRLRATDFGLTSLEALPGQAFRFFAEDARGATSISDEMFITRIISTSPVINSPRDNAAVQTPFEFQWTAVSKPYPFTYRIEIFLNVEIALPPEDVISGIPSTGSSFLYENSALPPDNYFWVLFIVDEFGNHSRSVPGGFIIQ